MIIKFPKKEVMDSAEDGQEVAPSVGDEVVLPKVVGVVQKEDGDMLVVQVKSVGEHECGMEDDGGEEEDDSESTDLRSKLAKMEEE